MGNSRHRHLSEESWRGLSPLQLKDNPEAGVRTEITPRIDYESKGDKVLSTEILPFCRARDVAFTGSLFKPRTRLYAFFDNVDVTQYVTPTPPFVNKYSKLNGALTDSTELLSLLIQPCIS